MLLKSPWISRKKNRLVTLPITEGPQPYLPRPCQLLQLTSVAVFFPVNNRNVIYKRKRWIQAEMNGKTIAMSGKCATSTNLSFGEN